MNKEEIKILEVERKKVFNDFRNSEYWSNALEESFKNIANNLDFGYILGNISCLFRLGHINEHSYNLIFEYICDYTGGNK